MKRILVTGCAGFIGSHLSEKLLNTGQQVFGIDNFDPFYDVNIKRRNLSHFINHPNFSFIEVDLADKPTFEALFPDGIDLIMHLAAKTGVRSSIEDPSGYIRANIVATQNVLDLMKEKGICKMAFASSSSVYGNTKETPFHEGMDVSNPISPYAFTKKACELINYTYHHLYQLDIVNLRFFTVFGPRQRPDLAIHKFTKLIRKGKPITLYGDGSTARDYTYIEDTLAGIIGSIEYLFKHEGVFETVNLGNNHPVGLKKMVQTIYDATGETPNLIYQPMQPGDVDITFADISKAQNLFAYQPAYSFDDGVKRFVEWYDDMAVRK
jgi:UDP-glucuronate 4-epimerase